MRDTLKKFFTSAATHHTAMAALAQSAMGGCEEDSDQHTLHKTAMESHISHAQCCTECAKACTKADGDELDKLAPTAISRVTPTPPHLKMVPRAGMQPVPDKQQNPVFTEVYGGTEGDA